MLASNYGPQFLLVSEGDDQYRKMTDTLRNEEGVAVTSTFRRNGFYFFVVSEGTGWNRPGTRTVWHPERNLGTEEGPGGSYITSLVKTGDLWEARLHSNTGITGQRVAALDDWDALDTHIRSEWDRDRVITDMVNRDGRYYVVTSSGLEWNQSWYMDPGYPETAILRAGAEDGMTVSEVMRVEDEYLWILSSETGHWVNHVEMDPSPEFMEMAMVAIGTPGGLNGYRLALVREVQGKICLIMSK